MRSSFFPALTLAIVGFTHPGKAEAEFGCKVLLCAASENPSWHGVPYCVPVMTKLYSMMQAWSFTWPVCTDAGTGAPGYEPYDDCPEGWQANVIDGGSSSGVFSVAGHGGGQQVCHRYTQSFFGCNGENKGSNVSGNASCLQTIPRPLRADPYYFDIPEHKRVYFSVR